MKTEPSNSSELQYQDDQSNKEICAKCGTVLVGEYCHGCGEKPLTHHDLTVKHFVAHTVEYFSGKIS